MGARRPQNGLVELIQRIRSRISAFEEFMETADLLSALLGKTVDAVSVD